MKLFYTYIHCKPDGTPFYIGKGSNNRSHDFIRGRSAYHQRIVSKYGRDNIKIYIFHCDSEEQAFEDEMQHIAQLTSEGYLLCNHTGGGEGLRNPSVETRLKMSSKKIGRKLSDKTKILISKRHKGRKNNLDQNDNISKSLIGRKLSEQHKINISISQIGRVPWNKGVSCSEQTRLKISASKKGCAGFNQKHSEETKRKISEKQRKKKIIGKFGNVEFHFSSIREAQKILSIHNISKALSGIQKTCGGYAWEYSDNLTQVEQFGAELGVKFSAIQD